MKPLSLNEPEKIILAMGNEAIVRGGLEAGIGYFSTYPGTPASEIGQGFIDLGDEFSYIHTEFSINELVATHGAMGASWANVRSMTAMKQVGMNVAAEAFHFSGYTGVGAGFVIVIGSDPGATSSTTEQDDRWYSLHTHLPVLEPATIQEAKDFTVKAFGLSEKYNIPVILNTPSKLCHNIGSLRLEKIPEIVSVDGNFKRNPVRYINLFGGAVKNHKNLLESIKVLQRDVQSLGFNRVIPGTDKIGFISSSINYLYLMEALSMLGLRESPVLKIGISYPINEEEILSFIKDLEKVYIVEDLEGFLEFQIKHLLYNSNLRVPIVGKSIFPEYGELDVDLISSILRDEFKIPPSERLKRILQLTGKLTKDIPPRQGAFCTGCPHRATLYSIVKATGRKAIFGGDIGCYTLACLPPFKSFDWVTCMNCGAGIGQGMFHANVTEDILAYVGDSTFFHSGIPNLINAIEQDVSLVLVILDNKWVSMTGHQPSPTTKTTLNGEKLKPVDLKGLLKSIGVSYVRTIKPFNIKSSIVTIKDALRERNGVRVIISEQECALQNEKRIIERHDGLEVYYQIDPERCQKCDECYVELGCPSIRKMTYDNTFDYYIEETTCLRCGSCHDICPNSAIGRVEIKRMGPRLETS